MHESRVWQSPKKILHTSCFSPFPALFLLLAHSSVSRNKPQTHTPLSLPPPLSPYNPTPADDRWVEETREREAKRAQLIEAEHRAHADRLAKLHLAQARAEQIRRSQEHEKAAAFEKGQKERAGAVRRKVVGLQKAIDMEHGDKAKLERERRQEREALRGEYEKARHAVVVGKAALRLSRKQVQEARERVKLGAKGSVGEELASHSDALAMLQAKVGKDEERVREIEHKLYASSDARRL
jgi:hypothetical protein